MLNSKTILNTVAALAIVTVAVPLSAGRAQAYACVSQYAQGVGVSGSKSQAEGLAKNKWTASVKGYLGLSWSVWNIAKSKSVTCAKRRAPGSRGKILYKCTARAKPCNYVVQ